MAPTNTNIDTFGYATSAASARSSTRGGPAPPMLVMDPEGDVILVVTFNKRMARIQINSSILCVASPVFRAMLGRHSHFKEATALAAARARLDSETAYELTLPDDNPKALAVVLRILHAKNILVPQSLTESQLYEVAVICDKYDLAPAIMHWTDRWIPLLVPDESKQPPTVTGHKWLFIAYVFGRQSLFKTLTQELILNSKIDASGALVITAKDGTVTNEYTPDCIIREIMTCRQQCIETLLDRVHGIMDTYSKVDSGHLECKNTPKEEGCDSFVVGFLLRTFTRKQVYPVASREVMQKSLRQVKHILDDITFPTQIYCSNMPAPKTWNCSYCAGRGYGSRKVAPNGNCSSCGQYTYPSQLGPNHSNTCSPVPNFKKDIQAIYDKVVGLDGECFIRLRKNTGEAAYMPRAGQSLWDLVQYEPKEQDEEEEYEEQEEDILFSLFD